MRWRTCRSPRADEGASRRRCYSAVGFATLLALCAAPRISAQALRNRIEDLFGDGRAFTVYVMNPLTVSVRIVNVQVYACVETGLGCGPGSGASGIVIGPRQEAAIAQVTRAGCTNPVDADGQTIRDECSARPKTDFKFSYGVEQVERGTGARPTVPSQPSSDDSQSAARSAEQERIQRERQAREREQAAERAQRDRAEQKRSEDSAAEKQRQLDRDRQAQRDEDMRQQLADQLERQRIEQQREIDRQREEARQRQEELRRLQEQRRREYDERLRAVRDRVQKINENTARAQSDLDAAVDQIRASIERRRLEDQQRAAQRELARAEQEAEQQRVDAQRERTELEQQLRRQADSMQQAFRSHEERALRAARARESSTSALPGKNSNRTSEASPPLFDSFERVFTDSSFGISGRSPDFASLFAGVKAAAPSDRRVDPASNIATGWFDGARETRPTDHAKLTAATWISSRCRQIVENINRTALVGEDGGAQAIRVEDALGVGPGELRPDFIREKAMWSIVIGHIYRSRPVNLDVKSLDSFRGLFDSRK